MSKIKQAIDECKRCSGTGKALYLGHLQDCQKCLGLGIVYAIPAACSECDRTDCLRA